MTLTVFSTSSVVAGFAHTFAASGDDLIILSGVTVGSTGTAALSGLSLNDLTVSVQGTLLSASPLTFSGFRSQITIGETGRFISTEGLSGNGAIFLSGDGATLNNNGTIESASSIGILSGGQTNIINSGKVFGGTGGVFMGLGPASGDSLTNSGTITAGNSSDSLIGSRFNNAVQAEGAGASIVNLAGGVLLATSSEGNGINFGSGASAPQVYNAGSIIAQVSFGIDAFDMGIATGITLRNLGTVYGAAGSVRGSMNADTIRNTGTLDGDVDLAASADILRNSGAILGDVDTGLDNDQMFNRGGLITGGVDLGAGNDLLNTFDGTVQGVILCGDGNDVVISNAAVDEGISGGNNFDILDFRNGPAIAVALDGTFANRGGAFGDEYADFEAVFGSAAGNDTIRGDAGLNTLLGRGGNDSLDGAGGSDGLDGGTGADTLNGGVAIDTLSGGLGNDVFVFDGLNSFNDIITDFNNVVGDNDRFSIARADLEGGLVAGQITANMFRTRLDNVAQDADDRFIFDTDSFVLWYDKDGNGASGPIQIAFLQEGAVVVASDIFIV